LGGKKEIHRSARKGRLQNDHKSCLISGPLRNRKLLFAGVDHTEKGKKRQMIDRQTRRGVIRGNIPRTEGLPERLVHEDEGAYGRNNLGKWAGAKKPLGGGLKSPAWGKSKRKKRG